MSDALARKLVAVVLVFGMVGGLFLHDWRLPVSAVIIILAIALVVENGEKS